MLSPLLLSLFLVTSIASSPCHEGEVFVCSDGGDDKNTGCSPTAALARYLLSIMEGVPLMVNDIEDLGGDHPVCPNSQKPHLEAALHPSLSLLGLHTTT